MRRSRERPERGSPGSARRSRGRDQRRRERTQTATLPQVRPRPTPLFRAHWPALQPTCMLSVFNIKIFLTRHLLELLLGSLPPVEERPARERSGKPCGKWARQGQLVLPQQASRQPTRITNHQHRAHAALPQTGEEKERMLIGAAKVKTEARPRRGALARRPEGLTEAGGMTAGCSDPSRVARRGPGHRGVTARGWLPSAVL